MGHPAGPNCAPKAAETIAKAQLLQIDTIYFPQVTISIYAILDFSYTFVPLKIQHPRSKWLIGYVNPDCTKGQKEEKDPLTSVIMSLAGG